MEKQTTFSDVTCYVIMSKTIRDRDMRLCSFTCKRPLNDFVSSLGNIRILQHAIVEHSISDGLGI